MEDSFREGFAFVIDTDSYAGNFERELCAFVTGQVGDCEVGTPNPSYNYDEFEGTMMWIPDDNGCRRPVSLTWGPDKKPNSVALYFEIEPNVPMIEIMKHRSTEFCENNTIKILEFRLIQRETITTDTPISI